MAYTLDECWTDVDGLVRIKDDETYLYGLINSEGDIVVPCEYDMIIHLDDNIRLGAVSRNGKWGFIDNYGREVVPCEYDRVSDRFYCERAEVRKYGKSGFINGCGTLMIPCQYDEVSIFFDEMVSVKKDDKWGIVDKLGHTIFDFNYDKLYVMGNGIVIAGKRSLLGFGPIKYGIFDYNANPVTDFIYNKIGNQVLKNGRILFQKGNTHGYVDKYGNENTIFG
jgi:hypothetical protein